MLRDTLRYAVRSRIGRQAWPIFALALLLPAVAYVLARTTEGRGNVLVYLPLILTGATALALVSWYFLLELVRHVELEQVAWDAGNEGALLLDAQGCVRRSNRVLRGWLGFRPRGSGLGRKDWDDLVARAQRNPRGVCGWVQTVKTRRYLRVQHCPLQMYEKGWALVAFFDQTDEFLRQHQLAFTRHKVERASQAKDRFLEVIDREIRNPLGGLCGWTELARHELRDTGGLTPTLEEALGNVDRCARGLLVEALEYAALDNPKARERMERVVLGDFVDFWAENYRMYFPAQNIDFQVRVDEELRSEVLELHLRYLRKTLMCLLDSAWKYAEREVVLEIRGVNNALAPLRQVRFTVKDDSRVRKAAALEDILLHENVRGSVQSNDFGLGLVQAARLLRVQRASALACRDRVGGGVEVSFELVAARVNLEDWTPLDSPRSLCYISLDAGDLEPLGLFEHVHWEPSIDFALEAPVCMDVYLVGTDAPDFSEEKLAELQKRGLVIVLDADEAGETGSLYPVLRKPLTHMDVLQLKESRRVESPFHLAHAQGSGI